MTRVVSLYEGLGSQLFLWLPGILSSPNNGEVLLERAKTHGHCTSEHVYL